jgi:regulatory protein
MKDKQAPDKPARKIQPRKAKPLTETRLRNIALHYLGRYASASENLRRVLMRRIAKARMEDPAAAPGAEIWIDVLIERFESAGVLDDAVYAEAQVQTLHRRGVSAKGIRHRLTAKGVGTTIIDAALNSLGNSDMTAACHYARRRRLGPWRRKNRASKRDRDLAALGRQGFSYQIASTVIDSPDVEILEILEAC